MWPMTDAEAVLFIMTVALLVGTGAGGDEGLEQHKAPAEGGAARAFGSARRSAGQERADEFAVTRREASLNTTCI